MVSSDTDQELGAEPWPSRFCSQLPVRPRTEICFLFQVFLLNNTDCLYKVLGALLG